MLLSLPAFLTFSLVTTGLERSCFLKRFVFAEFIPFISKGILLTQAVSGKLVTWNWLVTLDTDLLRDPCLWLVLVQNTLCVWDVDALTYMLRDWMDDALTRSSNQTSRSDKWIMYFTCDTALSRKHKSWRRKWQPTRVFLPWEFHGQRSLADYSSWSCKESDTTEWLTHIHRKGLNSLTWNT